MHEEKSWSRGRVTNEKKRERVRERERDHIKSYRVHASAVRLYPFSLPSPLCEFPVALPRALFRDKDAANRGTKSRVRDAFAKNKVLEGGRLLAFFECTADTPGWRTKMVKIHASRTLKKVAHREEMRNGGLFRRQWSGRFIWNNERFVSERNDVISRCCV